MNRFSHEVAHMIERKKSPNHKKSPFKLVERSLCSLKVILIVKTFKWLKVVSVSTGCSLL